MIVVYPQFFFLPVIKDTELDEDDLYRVFEDPECLEECFKEEKDEPKNILDEIDDEYVAEETESAKYKGLKK